MDADNSVDIITSRSNSVMKLVRSLSERRASRYKNKQFLAEGTRVLKTLASASIQIHTLIVDDGRSEDISSELINSLTTSDTRVVRVEGGLYRDIATTENPQPLMAICNMPVWSAEPPLHFVVVLDGIADPGNAGTIIRSAVAFGASSIVTTHGTVDPFNPKTVRASAGLVGSVPIIHIRHISELAERATSQKLTIVFADSQGEKALNEVEWHPPIAIIFGSESEGVTSESRAISDFGVRIPMKGHAESLNVAASASIILHHIADQIGAF